MEASMERAEGRKPGTQSVERTRGLRQPAAGKDKLGQRTAPGEEGCSAWRDQEFPEPASNRPQLQLGAVGLRQSCVSSTVGRTHTPTHPHTCLGKTKGRSLGPVGAVGSLFCSGPSSRADVLLAGCPRGVHVPSSGLLCRSGNRQGVMADHICLSVCLSLCRTVPPASPPANRKPESLHPVCHRSVSGFVTPLPRPLGPVSRAETGPLSLPRVAAAVSSSRQSATFPELCPPLRITPAIHRQVVSVPSLLFARPV